MVTSRDVARLAGVSQSTVSYVMSGRRSISAETRRRVESAIQELAFQPNAGARALKSQRTQVIGLVVPFGTGADTSGLLPFIETIANCAREQDHDILLVTRDEGSAGLTRLASRSLCDAIVLMDIEEHDARIPVAAALPVPVILIGLPADPLGLPCVDLDFEEAGRLAVAHLATTGHDRIVLIGHPHETVAREVNFVGRFRRAAQAAAAEHDLPCTVINRPDRGPAGIAAALDQILATARTPVRDRDPEPDHTPTTVNPPETGRLPAATGHPPETGHPDAATGHPPETGHPDAATGHPLEAHYSDAGPPTSRCEVASDPTAGHSHRDGPRREAGSGGRLGLVVHDTEAVQPVLHELAARGLLPGRDLSVVGLCPDVLAESTTPPVTNVSLEPRDVSRRAMRTLFRLLDRDRAAAVEPVDLVAPRLTRRATTRSG